MPKTLLNPATIDDRLREIEQWMAEIDEKIELYSSPCHFSEGISIEERKLYAIEDQKTLKSLRTEREEFELQRLELIAQKNAIARAREDEANKKRMAARQAIVYQAEPLKDGLNMSRAALNKVIDGLLERDRECQYLGKGYLETASKEMLILIKEYINADEIKNLRTIK